LKILIIDPEKNGQTQNPISAYGFSVLKWLKKQKVVERFYKKLNELCHRLPLKW
jgi:hypothetical protein